MDGSGFMERRRRQLAWFRSKKRHATAGDPETRKESELTADSLSEIFPTAIHLGGSLGSVEQPKEGRTGHLMPPLPEGGSVGTGALVKIGDKRMQPTLEDDSLASFTPPFQPEEPAEVSELTRGERLVRKSLYGPDGTIRLCTRAETAKIEDKKLDSLVEALLDKYNDNQDDDKTKVADDDAGSTNLFFVEVARDHTRDMLGYQISALSPVGSNGDGAICYGCRNNGSTDMKHPLPLVCELKGGHKDICFPCGFGPSNENQWRGSDDDEARDQKMKKAKLQNMYKYLDDPE